MAGSIEYFAPRQSVELVEEGFVLAPKFGPDGLLPVVTTDAMTGEVLMMGVMNRQALLLTTRSVKLTIGAAVASVYGTRAQRANLFRKLSKSGLTTIRMPYGCGSR